MIVKNLNKTTDRRCKCESWLAHWERFNSGGVRLPVKCAVACCKDKAEVGAHVKKFNSNDENDYIAPLCKACNCKDGIFDIGDTPLASANVSKTCG